MKIKKKLLSIEFEPFSLKFENLDLPNIIDPKQIKHFPPEAQAILLKLRSDFKSIDWLLQFQQKLQDYERRFSESLQHLHQRLNQKKFQLENPSQFALLQKLYEILVLSSLQLKKLGLGDAVKLGGSTKSVALNFDDIVPLLINMQTVGYLEAMYQCFANEGDLIKATRWKHSVNSGISNKKRENAQTLKDRHQNIHQAYNRWRKAHPSRPFKTEAYRAVAKMFSCSERLVKKIHLENSPKKK